MENQYGACVNGKLFKTTRMMFYIEEKRKTYSEKKFMKV